MTLTVRLVASPDFPSGKVVPVSKDDSPVPTLLTSALIALLAAVPTSRIVCSVHVWSRAFMGAWVGQRAIGIQSPRRESGHPGKFNDIASDVGPTTG